MTQKHIGWLVGIAATGMMLGLIGKEVAELPQLADALTPKFIGDTMVHLSLVIAAFVGGKLVPTEAAKE